jgi:NADH:ubiquinone oxidoreductase subunit 3 (subunit A)
MTAEILPFEAFWLFITSFFITGLLLPIIAYLLIGRRRGEVREDTFECGQEIDMRPNDVTIVGAMKYFGYAVAFFVLDAFVWILMASTNLLTSVSLAPLYLGVIIYIGIILIGIYFFLQGLEEIKR